MIEFNNIPSEYDEDIDETFYQWCITNDQPYNSDDPEYPIEFQSYYITNVYSHTSQGVITY